MASDGSNRTHLACKFCLKTTDRLSQHLRKVCRKGASDAEIEALVEESRSKMRMLVKNLSVVNYEQLRAGADSQKSLQFFTNFLESNGCFISGKPVEADDAIQNPVTDAEEIEDEMDTEHPLLMLSTSASKISSKKVMEEAGLHKKHSDDSPLLQAFRRYLEKKYAKSGIKQEVQNVSRWLYFVNPNEASVSCIHNIERSMQFFKEIGASAASKATLRNYIGAVKKFISYVTSDPQLLEKDSSLRGSIESFLKSMMEVQRTTYKEKSVGRKATNPKECQEVLTNAHPYFVEVIDRANVKTDLEERDMTLVLFYLEALLTLQHLQKPSVLLNMTVQQWLERTRYQGHATGSVAAVIKVKAEREHIIVLQEAEEMWFDTFFRRIRPIFIKRNLKGENEIFLSPVKDKKSRTQHPMSADFKKGLMLVWPAGRKHWTFLQKSSVTAT
ncbi:uncharacterized protein LOC121401387 [Xenopus laevis]|uniref:Uncharacterized protein LOC121401387 n=1 Tax=Xenopus laevis TaxID=8355 RepID=A0A8J1MLL4_XENLA|nr:uncharacterized protein LOC121401387 [Xenopus laevis]